MATQDLTTYTKVDPDSKLTVTAPKVVWAAGATHTTQLYNDFGAAHFNATFRHNFDFECDSNSGNQTNMWSMQNTIEDAASVLTNNHALLSIDVFKNGTNNSVEISEFYIGAGPNSSTASASLFNATTSTTYYAQVYFNSALGANGTLFCYIYGNTSDRTNGTSAVASASIALHAAVSFRYFYAFNSYSQNPMGSGFTQNFDLAAAAPPTNSGNFLAFM